MTRHISLRSIRAEMDRRDFRLKHRWGQNFLIERRHLDFMVGAGNVTAGDLVLEVGSGPGGLTAALLESGATVRCVEIDPLLMEIGKQLVLARMPDGASRIAWIRSDFLESKNRIHPAVVEAIRSALETRPDLRLKVISNLPYAVATPAIVNLLESRLPWTVMVVTIQEEVADRLTARPGDAPYGQLTLIARALGKVRVLKRVKPGAFWPVPKVGSSIIQIEPGDEIWGDEEESYGNFKRFTRDIFAHRRKTWVKSLKLANKPMDLDRFLFRVAERGFQTDLRAQQLSYQHIRELSVLFGASNPDRAK